MCLYPNPEPSTKQENKWKKDGVKSITVYKRLILDCTRNIPKLDSPLYSSKWQSGLKRSGVKRCKANNGKFKPQVCKGIHVYSKIRHAGAIHKNQQHNKKVNIIVPLKAETKNYMGEAYGHMAFSQVYLTKKVYDKIVSLYRKIQNTPYKKLTKAELTIKE